MVECKICGKSFQRLSSHVRIHDISLSEYERKFPGARTSEPAAPVRKEIEASAKLVRRTVSTNKKVHVDKVCKTCGKPLHVLTWGANGDKYVLVCDNNQCQRYRQPQGSGYKRDRGDK